MCDDEPRGRFDLGGSCFGVSDPSRLRQFPQRRRIMGGMSGSSSGGDAGGSGSAGSESTGVEGVAGGPGNETGAGAGPNTIMDNRQADPKAVKKGASEEKEPAKEERDPNKLR